MSISTVTETEPAWGRAHRLWRPDLPLVWLTIGLAGFGALVLQATVAAAFDRQLSATSLAVVVWALYAVPFVLIVIFLDLLEPEPPAFLGSAFAWGALVAAPIALVANRSAQAIMTNLWGTELTARWAAAVVAPVNEEVLKALGVVVVVLVARRQVTTVLDGIVYGAFVGLGFQVAENFVYTTDALTGGLFGAEPGQVVLDMFVLRGLELGMWSHVVYTALAGFGIAYAVVETGRGRVQRVVVCAAALLCAWGVHALWNAPFTQVPADAGPWEAWGVYAVKGLPALVLVLVLVAFARGREVAWFADELSEEDADVVTPGEQATLRTRRTRRAAVAQARSRGGTAAVRAARRLQALQVELAVRRAVGAPEEDLAAARNQVVAARQALDHLVTR